MVELIDRPIALPDSDAPQSDWDAAADQLNTVHFTGRQLYRAMQAYIAVPPDGLDLSGKDRALADYLRSEGLGPIGLACLAARVRHDWLLQYACDLALDLSPEEWPAYYEAAARARLAACYGQMEPMHFDELVEMARDVAW